MFSKFFKLLAKRITKILPNDFTYSSWIEKNDAIWLLLSQMFSLYRRLRLLRFSCRRRRIDMAQIYTKY